MRFFFEKRQGDDNFKPLIRSISEFKFWQMVTFAIILSIIFLHEAVGTLQVIGMVLILVSIMFSNLGGLIKKFRPKKIPPTDN